MTQSLGLTVPANPAEAEPDPALLRAEFNEIMRAAEAGEFDYKGDPNDVQAKAKFEEMVRQKVRRGIELQTILRRQNTGPAKPKAAGRGRKSAKAAPDQAAILQSLLD